MNSNSIDLKEIRKFGLIALIFFGLLFTLAFWRHKTLLSCFFGALSLLGFGFLIIPFELIPVYSAWIKIAHLIGRVITTTILAIAYYTVITPFAVIKRLCGGAPLHTKPNKNLSSYWVTRDVTAQPKDRFIKRY